MLVHAYPRVEEPAPKLKRSSNSPSVLPPPFSTASGATNPFSQPDAAAPQAEVVRLLDSSEAPPHVEVAKEVRVDLPRESLEPIDRLDALDMLKGLSQPTPPQPAPRNSVAPLYRPPTEAEDATQLHLAADPEPLARRDSSELPPGWTAEVRCRPLGTQAQARLSATTSDNRQEVQVGFCGAILLDSGPFAVRVCAGGGGAGPCWTLSGLCNSKRGA